MAIYKVTYRSMTASYGPRYIEADDEYEAKQKFAGTAFSRNEIGLMHARELSSSEIKSALDKNSVES